MPPSETSFFSDGEQDTGGNEFYQEVIKQPDPPIFEVNILEESIDEALVIDELPINPRPCQVHPIQKSRHPIELKHAPERHQLQSQVSSIAIFEDI